jgi:hypothetical protein
LPIFVFSLAAHEDALLDCDPDATFPAAPPTADALLEAAAVGERGAAPDMVVALQSPADFDLLSGLSCGGRHGNAPVRRKPRDPARSVLAAAASLLAGTPASVAPHPTAGAAQNPAATAAGSWLLAAAELPWAPMARHVSMSPLAADLVARFQVAKVLEASVVLDRAALALLAAIVPAQSPAASSQRPGSAARVRPGVNLSFALHRALGDARRLLDRARRRRQAVAALAGGWGDFKGAAPHLNLLLADSRAAYRAAEAATAAAAKQRCADVTPALLRDSQGNSGGRRGPKRRVWVAFCSALAFAAAAAVVALFVLGAETQQAMPHANTPRKQGVAVTVGQGLRQAKKALQASLSIDLKGKAE